MPFIQNHLITTPQAPNMQVWAPLEAIYHNILRHSKHLKHKMDGRADRWKNAQAEDNPHSAQTMEELIHESSFGNVRRVCQHLLQMTNILILG